MAKAFPNSTAPTGPKPPATAAAVPKPPISAAKASVGNVSNPAAAASKGLNPVPSVSSAPAPRSSRSTTASNPREKECTINKTKYFATYSSGDKKWKVKIKRKDYLIEFTTKSVVKIDGETWDVVWQ